MAVGPHHVNVLVLLYNVCALSGAEEHGALCGPEQPHQDTAVIPTVDGEDHGGVLPTG